MGEVKHNDPHDAEDWTSSVATGYHESEARIKDTPHNTTLKKPFIPVAYPLNANLNLAKHPQNGHRQITSRKRDHSRRKVPHVALVLDDDDRNRQD